MIFSSLNQINHIERCETFENLSKKALYNIKALANWRIEQLTFLKNNLEYLCEVELMELEEMYSISDSLDSIINNQARFKKLTEELDYWIMRKTEEWNDSE